MHGKRNEAIFSQSPVTYLWAYPQSLSFPAGWYSAPSQRVKALMCILEKHFVLCFWSKLKLHAKTCCLLMNETRWCGKIIEWLKKQIPPVYMSCWRRPVLLLVPSFNSFCALRTGWCLRSRILPMWWPYLVPFWRFSSATRKKFEIQSRKSETNRIGLGRYIC